MCHIFSRFNNMLFQTHIVSGSLIAEQEVRFLTVKVEKIAGLEARGKNQGKVGYLNKKSQVIFQNSRLIEMSRLSPGLTNINLTE